MYESLGWMSNCPDESQCPRNWLDRSPADLPTSVPCQVCGRTVELAKTQEDFESANAELGAYPVVPCVGVPGTAWRVEGGRAGAAPSVPVAPVTDPSALPAVNPALRHREASPSKAWVVKFENGESAKLLQTKMVMGRSRKCEVVVPSAKVSRQHANLDFVEGNLFIEDVGSANGIWQDGEKITRAKVNPGDTFYLSDEAVVFDLE